MSVRAWARPVVASGDAWRLSQPMERKRREATGFLFCHGVVNQENHRSSNGIEQFAWRPADRNIAYVTSDEPANKKEMEKHHDAFEVGDNDFLATEAALLPTFGFFGRWR